MMSNRSRLGLFALLGLLLAGTAVTLLRPRDRTAQPTLVASIQPLADIVASVAGGDLAVRSLLPPGASPHTFEPTPLQIAELSDARVFFRIGLGLELWADKIVASAAKHGLEVVTVSTGIEPMPVEGHGDHEEEAGGVNPHVWLDPVLAMVITRNVRDALSQAFPAEAAGFATRARVFLGELERLDARYREALAGVPSRKVVVFHTAFDYLARRYGLQIVGVIEETPGREPGARHVANLIDRIRSSGAAAVIAEPQLNPRIAEAIAASAGVPVVRLDPLGSPDDPKTMTYVGLMDTNLHRLVAALSGEKP